MGLFNFFGKSNNNSPTPKPKKEAGMSRDAMKERLMNTLTQSLSAHNFSRMEIKEVYDIIELAEADIQTLKGGKRLPKGVNLQIFCIFWCIDSITVNEVEKEIR